MKASAYKLGNSSNSFFSLKNIKGLLHKHLIQVLLTFVLIVFIYPINVHAEEIEEAEGAANVISLPTADTKMGEATSSIPIAVPSGRNGIQPNLALTYSSSNKKSGFAGKGWSLNLGYIQRNTKYGLDYDFDGNNAFVASMNGASGELVQRTIGGISCYGLEIEGAFYKFQYLGEASGWVVTSKDGKKYYFGQTSSSQQYGDVYDPGTQQNVQRTFKWCLDKVEDTNGNYMEIEYSNPSNATLQGDFLDDNEIYPKEIKYTGNCDFPKSCHNFSRINGHKIWDDFGSFAKLKRSFGEELAKMYISFFLPN